MATTKKATKAPVKKTVEKAKEPAKKTVKKTTAKVEEVKNIDNKDSIAYNNVSILLAMAVEALILLLGYLIIINA